MQRGENAGRQLAHAAVVRALAQHAARGGGAQEFELAPPADANLAHLAAVVWLQTAPGGLITALAEIPAG